MLGERLNFTITIDEKEIDLKLTIEVLKNLYKLTGQDPFDFLKELIQEENPEVLKRYINQLLICMTDEDIIYINDNILNDENNILTIKQAIQIFIMEEIRSEVKPEKKEEQEQVEVEDQEQEQEKETFIDRYNFMYYMCIYQIGMREQEFLSLTVREINTLIDFHSRYEKGTILRAYSDIVEAQNKVQRQSIKAKEEKQEDGVRRHVKGDGVRIKSLLLNM